jgi:hypothetical protein
MVAPWKLVATVKTIADEAHREVLNPAIGRLAEIMAEEFRPEAN